MRGAVLASALLLGCQEYRLRDQPDPVETDDTDLPVETDAPDTDVPDTDVLPDTDLPPCDETIDADWTWWGSPAFTTQPDPVDDASNPFWHEDFVMDGWSVVALPDTSVPSGSDRAYRAVFDVQTVPDQLLLSMQSDDGVWFWLNGQPVGHWGGDWQQEGCVNDDANCETYVLVAPVDVTSYLRVGRNVAAARISNPVAQAWFDTYTECRDE